MFCARDGVIASETVDKFFFTSFATFVLFKVSLVWTTFRCKRQLSYNFLLQDVNSKFFKQLFVKCDCHGKVKFCEQGLALSNCFHD